MLLYAGKPNWNLLASVTPAETRRAAEGRHGLDVNGRSGGTFETNRRSSSESMTPPVPLRSRLQVCEEVRALQRSPDIEIKDDLGPSGRDSCEYRTDIGETHRIVNHPATVGDRAEAFDLRPISGAVVGTYRRFRPPIDAACRRARGPTPPAVPPSRSPDDGIELDARRPVGKKDDRCVHGATKLKSSVKDRVTRPPRSSTSRITCHPRSGPYMTTGRPAVAGAPIDPLPSVAHARRRATERTDHRDQVPFDIIAKAVVLPAASTSVSTLTAARIGPAAMGALCRRILPFSRFHETEELSQGACHEL